MKTLSPWIIFAKVANTVSVCGLAFLMGATLNSRPALAESSQVIANNCESLLARASDSGRKVLFYSKAFRTYNFSIFESDSGETVFQSRQQDHYRAGVFDHFGHKVAVVDVKNNVKIWDVNNEIVTHSFRLPDTTSIGSFRFSDDDMFVQVFSTEGQLVSVFDIKNNDTFFGY